MTTQIINLMSTAGNRFATWVRKIWAFNPLITFVGLLHLVLIPLLMVAWVIDPKTILGMPAWIKPLKFAISIAIYSFSFAWLLTYVQGWPRLVKFVANATGIALIIEMMLITTQVIRGTTSHFNASTPFDSAVFSMMGVFIMMAAVLNLLIAIRLLIQKMPDPVFAWGLRLGILLSFIGMAEAGFMVGPTPAQLATMQTGKSVAAIGAHSVGVDDGGPGLPLVGWSTTGGDFRVPHFFGLHGMQILPLVGWLLTQQRAWRRFSTKQRIGLVWTAGLGYLGLIGILTWQALRAQSVIAPDAATWTAFGVLTCSLLLIVVGINLWARKDQVETMLTSVSQ
ncbi:MAG: hypothetical protein NT075_32990 [Chloroflexi bacterium]|nr:hypothetical protein [Chloroflexota bacterium]